MLMAQELDKYSLNVVDKKMCSMDCPCYDESVEEEFEFFNPGLNELEHWNAKETYESAAFAEFLPYYGR